jgi:hypothetical protein
MPSIVENIVPVSIVVAVAALPCALVFLRPRWFRGVLATGAVLCAAFAIGMGLTENTADVDDHEWAFLWLIIGGLLLFAWSLGALWGHLFDRWRKYLRALQSQDGAPRRRRAG